MLIRSKLFSFVITDDTGFAPNPYHNFLTLACCKPTVRRVANVGDYVCANLSNTADAESRLLFIMRVTEKLTFDDYFKDDRFQIKKPVKNGTDEKKMGDNIYFRNECGEYQQAKNAVHHCGGDKMETDLGGEYVLISDDFAYWGEKLSPLLPAGLKGLIHHGRGHRSRKFPQEFKQNVFSWFAGLPEKGKLGNPNHSSRFI